MGKKFPAPSKQKRVDFKPVRVHDMTQREVVYQTGPGMQWIRAPQNLQLSTLDLKQRRLLPLGAVVKWRCKVCLNFGLHAAHCQYKSADAADESTPSITSFFSSPAAAPSAPASASPVLAPVVSVSPSVAPLPAVQALSAAHAAEVASIVLELEQQHLQQELSAQLASLPALPTPAAAAATVVPPFDDVPLPEFSPEEHAYVKDFIEEVFEQLLQASCSAQPHTLSRKPLRTSSSRRCCRRSCPATTAARSCLCSQRRRAARAWTAVLSRCPSTTCTTYWRHLRPPTWPGSHPRASTRGRLRHWAYGGRRG